jgi:outer membrane protein
MFRFLVIFVIAGGFGLTGAHAQESAPPANPDSALIEALSRIEGMPLNLEEVVSRAVRSSDGALQAQAALAASRGSLMRERGKFDPELFADLTKASERQPSASPFTGAAVLHPTTTNGDAGARITLPTGTELQASITGQKLETNSSFASLNPQYNATGSLSLRQPLLRGFGPAGWGDYLQAKIGFDAATERYENTMAGIRADAESMYWDLYAAERNLAVALLTRQQAQKLLDEATLRAQAGLVGPNQVNNAKVFLAGQELAVLDAEDNLNARSDQLASLIDQRPALPYMRYRTLDEPPHAVQSQPADSMMARALRTNHELKAAEFDVEAARATYRAAQWNALPKADLFAALGGNGLSGTGRDVIFGSDTLRNDFNKGFADALDQALNRDYPTWTIGVNVSIPILLREKRGERNRLRAEVDRAEANYLSVRHRIEEQVLASMRDLDNSQSRLRASEDGVHAAQDQVRIGLIEFRNGTTTAFELARLGTDFADAQRQYSQAMVRTAKAVARLRQLAPLDTEQDFR